MDTTKHFSIRYNPVSLKSLAKLVVCDLKSYTLVATLPPNLQKYILDIKGIDEQQHKIIGRRSVYDFNIIW